ncbi:MAG TPA: DNA-binding response regulator [Bacteroidales bacterium]|nr:DNA-binding response regulator [Bacteroidales bacterium]
MKVLVVEDEPKVAMFIKKGLEEQDFEVSVAYDGELGLALSKSGNFDIILLDLVVPFINGLQLCRLIRQTNRQVPILMVTALGTLDDKLAGFEAGADDYLLKPFEFSELLARMRALLKRNTGVIQSDKLIMYADLELNLDKKMAVRQGKSIQLTAKEFALLELFMNNAGKVLSREYIAEKVWEITFDTGTNVVDVYVNLLRKKVDKDFADKLIHTRIGMGYIFYVE